MDNKDKQALIDGTATIPYKLHILNDDGSIKDTLTEEDIVSTDYEDYRYVDSSSLCIGQFVARKLKGEIKTIDKDLQIEDKEISVEMGVNRNDGSKVYDITIDGKSEQTTYTGKNLFSSKLEVGGIDTTTGLNVTNNTRKRTKDFISIQPNTTYTFSYKNQGNYAKWGWYILYDNNQQILSSYAFENDYDVTFTSSNDAYYFKMYFGNATNVDVNSFDCQLEKGTVATEKEPYTGGQPSPNPDYPQEIKSVSGVENLFDKDTAKSGTFYNVSNGSIISSTIWSQSDFIQFEPNTKFTFSSSYLENNSSFEFTQFDGNKNWLMSKQFALTNGSWSETTNSNTKYVKVGFRNDRGVELNIQLEEDSLETIWQELSECLETAIDNFIDMRSIEGSKIKQDLQTRLSSVEENVNKISELSTGLVEEYIVKLEERIKELLKIDIVDKDRLAQEIVIYSDKCSTEEELTRLKSHIEQFKNLLEQEEPVGKKLDFLIQEMNRETNTIGSKSGKLEITNLVIEMKTVLEDIREQIQNIE